jgi:glycine/D-amino acid oxidase-like deaminating enzyme
MGASAAWRLAQQGVRVVVREQFELGHGRAHLRRGVEGPSARPA